MVTHYPTPQMVSNIGDCDDACAECLVMSYMRGYEIMGGCAGVIKMLKGTLMHRTCVSACFHGAGGERCFHD